MNAVTMRLRDIVIPPGRRTLRRVDDLAASIHEIGLINAITVTPEGTLVAGYHRLEACRSLGWAEVPVSVVTLSEVDRQLAEIDENLCRNEYTVLERAEQLARRKELYEAKHPSTRHGGAPGRSGGGKAPRAKDEIISSFAEETADRAGLTPRTVQQEVQIATHIIPEVKEQIWGTPVENNKTELLRLARMPAEEQKRAVEEKLSDRIRAVLNLPQEVAQVKVGMTDRHSFQRARWIVTLSQTEGLTPEETEIVAEAVTALDAGKGGLRLYQRILPLVEKYFGSAAERRGSPPQRIAATRLAKMEKLLVSVHTTCTMLDDVDLFSGLPSEWCAHAATKLAEAHKALGRFRRRFQETCP